MKDFFIKILALVTVIGIGAVLFWGMFHVPNGTEVARICHEGPEHPMEISVGYSGGVTEDILVHSSGCIKGMAYLVPGDRDMRFITFHSIPPQVEGKFFLQFGRTQDSSVIWGKKVEVGRGADGTFRVLLEGKDFPSEALLRLQVMSIIGG